MVLKIIWISFSIEAYELLELRLLTSDNYLFLLNFWVFFELRSSITLGICLIIN